MIQTQYQSNTNTPIRHHNITNIYCRYWRQEWIQPTQDKKGPLVRGMCVALVSRHYPCASPMQRHSSLTYSSISPSSLHLVLLILFCRSHRIGEGRLQTHNQNKSNFGLRKKKKQYGDSLHPSLLSLIPPSHPHLSIFLLALYFHLLIFILQETNGGVRTQQRLFRSTVE